MSSRLKFLLFFLVIWGLVALNLFQYFREISDEEIIRRYHQIAYDSGQWSVNRWLGVQAYQNPNDVWIHQEIIFDTKPDFIIEAGTQFGGGAALWATILDQVNPEGRVLTIDIIDQAQEARLLPIVQKKVDFLLGTHRPQDRCGDREARSGSQGAGDPGFRSQ